MYSAVLKSTKHSCTTASVTSSPACGTIPYEDMLSFELIAISAVPAPISTKAIFRSLKFLGTTASMAAIGSKVKLLTLNPTFFITVYSESITERGKNVAITSTDTFSPLCPIKLDITNPFK